MNDLDWIKEISNDKVEVLGWLLDIENLPNNLHNRYHDRLEMYQTHLEKSKKFLEKYDKDNYMAYSCIKVIDNKLELIVRYIESFNKRELKDKWVKMRFRKRMRRFKSDMKELRDIILTYDDNSFRSEFSNYIPL